MCDFFVWCAGPRTQVPSKPASLRPSAGGMVVAGGVVWFWTTTAGGGAGRLSGSRSGEGGRSKRMQWSAARFWEGGTRGRIRGLRLRGTASRPPPHTPTPTPPLRLLCLRCVPVVLGLCTCLPGDDLCWPPANSGLTFRQDSRSEGVNLAGPLSKAHGSLKGGGGGRLLCCWRTSERPATQNRRRRSGLRRRPGLKAKKRRSTRRR